MSVIKKVWLTDNGRSGIVSLSIESETVHPAYNRVNAHEMVFPSDAPQDNQRHTIVLGNFDEEDLFRIKDAIDEYLL